MVARGVSRTMDSPHREGLAVDLAYIRGGVARWEMGWYKQLDEFMQAATLEFGLDADDLVWGGHWTTLRDGVHWQLMRPRIDLPY